jgi:patatin-like phospholipase/acyl hydrolase
MMSYNIVCFCGGGIRGLLSATILEDLAHAYPNILTKTNLFAGTSTGAGIISWLLKGDPPADIIHHFLAQEVSFFSEPCTNPARPAYSIDKVVEGQVVLHGTKPLNAFSQSMLFTSFNVGSATSPTAHTPWRPILYSNLTNSPNGDTMIATAVASSSAMPGMLGSYLGNIDGAFVHHDPTLAAIAMAIHYEHVSLSDMVVICIGTGLMPNWIASDTHAWGAQQWQNGDGNPLSCTPALLVNGCVAPVLNASMNGTSVSLIPELAGMMLQSHYAYLNPTLAYYIPENDVKPADLQYLQAQAAHCDPQQMANARHLLKTYWR